MPTPHKFAEAVIGAPHTYDIPQQAYITKADAIAKKGILRMSGCTACEGERCLQCSTACKGLRRLLPNRANVVIHGRRQPPDPRGGPDVQRVRQLHPVLPLPLRALPLFQTAEDMRIPHNAGVLFLAATGWERMTSHPAPDAVRDRYSYLFA